MCNSFINTYRYKLFSPSPVKVQLIRLFPYKHKVRLKNALVRIYLGIYRNRNSFIRNGNRDENKKTLTFGEGFLLLISSAFLLIYSIFHPLQIHTNFRKKLQSSQSPSSNSNQAQIIHNEPKTVSLDLGP